jgi:hypothetical protein
VKIILGKEESKEPEKADKQVKIILGKEESKEPE